VNKIVAVFLIGALSIVQVDSCRAADKISNPLVNDSGGSFVIMMLDPSLEYVDTKIDEVFILNNSSLRYKVSTPSVVRRFNSVMPTEGSQQAMLPDWYQFVPGAVLKFSDGRQYLYDGCYIRVSPRGAYYLASDDLQVMVDQLSFSKHQRCE
jgi:hypothetical protein